MSLLEVIQWLCHGCSCETHLVPSAGISSRFRWTSGGFIVGRRWCGRHLLSWGHPCGSTCGHPEELTAPLALLPQSVLVNIHLSSWLGEGLCWPPGAAGPLLLTVPRPLGSCHRWPHVPSLWPGSCSPTCSAIFGACMVSCRLEGNVVIVAVSSLQGERRWFPMLVNQAAFSRTEFQQAFLNFFLKTLI